ncbi:MAG: hypothetical protein AAF226_06920, partial [Verrucomicrobiota bacterium]
MKGKASLGKEKAVALITVLLILALLIIMVVSWAATSTIEVRSSHSYTETQRAKVIAQGGLASAVNLLRSNIPEPAGIDQDAANAPAVNWSVNPGRLAIFDDSGKDRFVPLHTGAADVSPSETRDPDVFSVDLNEPVPGTSAPAVTYALGEDGMAKPDQPAPSMRVKWVNLLKDPSQPESEMNPITGRYAFWIDDESSKLNFNTARGKPSAEEDPDFHRQLDLGMMPSVFQLGDGSTKFRNTELGEEHGR